MTTARKKAQPIPKLVEKAATLLQKLRRMEEADRWGMVTCVTCGKRVHWKEADGGHFISRTYSSHKLNPKNINPQCKGCNRFGHKVADDYAMWMVNRHGLNYVEWMVGTKRDTVKWNRLELGELIEGYKLRIKQEEIRLAGV